MKAKSHLAESEANHELGGKVVLQELLNRPVKGVCRGLDQAKNVGLGVQKICGGGIPVRPGDLAGPGHKGESQQGGVEEEGEDVADLLAVLYVGRVLGGRQQAEKRLAKELGN